jgi:hypothetical protein
MVTQPEDAPPTSDDARQTLNYLLARESADYIALMDVLEQAVTDLTPAEVADGLGAAGYALEGSQVETRLNALHGWGAVSRRTDESRILRHADLLRRNWRYTATPAGRQVHRFYRTVLLGTPVLREIPLPSLARAVDALETLVEEPDAPADRVTEHIGRLFTAHDDLDGALVGAEDALTGLADRFDLDHAATAELKEMLLSYATRVAVELGRGSSRAWRALDRLRPRFETLATTAVEFSEARVLIERGALLASRGGRVEDWIGLQAWFHPRAGRASRFELRLVRALPGMHANLRRLHTSSGTATNRARAIALARASAHPVHGTAILLAATGDHPWRKLHGHADDDDLGAAPPWRSGPAAPVPDLLRATGRSGPRGRPAAARDDAVARLTVAHRRELRAAEHREAVREILRTPPGEPLSERAARVALELLLAATRSPERSTRRTSERDGLACTVAEVALGSGVLVGPSWRVILPGREFAFHAPGAVVALVAGPPALEGAA